jgi:hypothetical protein
MKTTAQGVGGQQRGLFHGDHATGVGRHDFGRSWMRLAPGRTGRITRARQRRGTGDNHTKSALDIDERTYDVELELDADGDVDDSAFRADDDA